MDKPTCTVEGCDRPRRYAEHCQKHYDATKRDRAQRNALRARQRADRPEVTAAYNRAYYAAHKASNAQRCRAWRQANADRHRDNVRRWREQNPEAVRAFWAKKQAVRRQRVGAHADLVDYAAIVAEHGMWCYLCEGDILTLDDLHIDHVIPLARGGAHVAANLRPTHALCNMRKGARLLSELDLPLAA